MRTQCKNKLLKARENAGDQVVIGFYLASDWLRGLDQSHKEASIYGFNRASKGMVVALTSNFHMVIVKIAVVLLNYDWSKNHASPSQSIRSSIKDESLHVLRVFPSSGS